MYFDIKENHVEKTTENPIVFILGSDNPSAL